jgi:endonuclease YncB( thermonuclease family)
MVARLVRIAGLLLAAILAAAPAGAHGGGRRAGAPGRILLDGQPTEVRWTDGDSFNVDSGPLRGFAARLQGYNTLEAYGPVHRIAGMDPAALEAIATSSAALLAGSTWRCSSEGRRDGYGRALVACPEAAAAVVRAGHAMVYAIDARPDPALLALQREAQAAGRGMWAGGVPPLIVASLHSGEEKGLRGKPPYDRLVDTRTGMTRLRHHRSSYRTCQEVCVGEGAARSCMVYVPFERRYRDRPACLAGGSEPPKRER